MKITSTLKVSSFRSQGASWPLSWETSRCLSVWTMTTSSYHRQARAFASRPRLATIHQQESSPSPQPTWSAWTDPLRNGDGDLLEELEPSGRSNNRPLAPVPSIPNAVVARGCPCHCFSRRFQQQWASVRRQAKNFLKTVAVEEVMTDDVISVARSDDVTKAAQWMIEARSAVSPSSTTKARRALDRERLRTARANGLVAPRSGSRHRLLAHVLPQELDRARPAFLGRS